MEIIKVKTEKDLKKQIKMTSFYNEKLIKMVISMKVQMLQLKIENENLKKEVVFHAKKAVKSERLAKSFEMAAKEFIKARDEKIHILEDKIAEEYARKVVEEYFQGKSLEDSLDTVINELCTKVMERILINYERGAQNVC